MPLSYDLTTFQIPGQKLSNFFVGILVEMMTPKGHFEINRPLARVLEVQHFGYSYKVMTNMYLSKEKHKKVEHLHPS